MTKKEFKDGVKKKCEDAKIIAGQKWDKACKWMEAHPGISLTAGIFLTKAVTTVIKDSYRDHRKIKMAKYDNEISGSDIWDPEAGVHYHTRCVLTNDEKLRLDTIHRETGISRGAILDDWGLL